MDDLFDPKLFSSCYQDSDVPVSVACVAYKYYEMFESLPENQSLSNCSNSLNAKTTGAKLLAKKLLEESCHWVCLSMNTNSVLDPQYFLK